MKVLSSLVVVVLIVFSYPFVCIGQDMIFSQYDNSPLYLNPADAGMFNGYNRTIIKNRGLFFDPSVYKTSYLSFDTPLYFCNSNGKNYGNDSRIGLGFEYHHDETGDVNLINDNVGLALSYGYDFKSHSKIKNSLIAFGIKGSYNWRRFDISEAKFGSQFNGLAFDNSIYSMEPVSDYNNSFFDLSAGVSLFGNAFMERKWNIGLAYSHIFNPNQSLLDEQTKTDILDGRISVNLKCDSIGLFKLFTIKPSLIYQKQSIASEFYIGFTTDLEVLNIGIFFRASKAYSYPSERPDYIYKTNSIIPRISIPYKKLNFDFSYDINFNGLDKTGNQFYYFEISLKCMNLFEYNCQKYIIDCTNLM